MPIPTLSEPFQVLSDAACIDDAACNPKPQTKNPKIWLESPIKGCWKLVPPARPNNMIADGRADLIFEVPKRIHKRIFLCP